jgi:RNA polymerase sigma-70 factor (ECF subfamily)
MMALAHRGVLLASQMSDDRKARGPSPVRAPRHPAIVREPSSERVPAGADVGDASLVLRARAGDDRAFAALFDRHADYLARVLHRSFGADAELDDIVQEAFLLARDHLASLEAPESFRAWLTSIALRQAGHVVRRRSFRGRLRELWAAAQPKVALPPDAEAHRARRALQALPPKYRVPWVLVRVEEASLAEAAEASGNSLTTLKRRLAKADEMLEKWLRNHP